VEEFTDLIGRCKEERRTLGILAANLYRDIDCVSLKYDNQAKPFCAPEEFKLDEYGEPAAAMRLHVESDSTEHPLRSIARPH
jgi:hypothetical protein